MLLTPQSKVLQGLTDSQEILQILRNLRENYRIHRSPTLVSIMSHNVRNTQTNSVSIAGECQQDINYTALTADII